ncbi:MAG: hypothetical protein AB7V56_06950 [Candidatus Nitrosocosmicus sp.]
MLSSSHIISGYIVFIFVLFILLPSAHILDVNGTVDIGTKNNDSTNMNNITNYAKDALVLINTTSLSNCLSQDFYEIQDTYRSDGIVSNVSSILDSQKNSLDTSEMNEHAPLHKGICKIYDISSESVDCYKYFAYNQSQKPCKTFDDSEEQIHLKRDNFGKKGYLLANTEFDNQYSFEITDPLNQDKKFRVSMDFGEHTQTENNDINSPRLEIVRENSEGLPDMTAAKNQEIIWTGNIFDYFEKPEDNFSNETYISIQFNTGRHGSSEDDEDRAFGVLFDVSGSTNPNLFEYRDDGKYVKYDYDTMKALAGDSFVFHHKDQKTGKPLFVDSLTNTENVKLKVRTLLFENNNTRTVETFIGNASSGVEIPYWTLNNLSKLKEHEDIDDENGFTETINQGSGYVIARTDNIDTRPSSFRSSTFND